MNLRTFIRYQRLNLSIILFIFIFSMIHFVQPGLIYNKDGSFRKFGVGSRDKTVISIWVVAIVLAIFVYTLVSSLQFYL
jgi:hypothetical protein